MSRKLVGLLPAAGRASRLGTLPCSKEILPVSVSERSADGEQARLVTAIDCSLLALDDAGIETAFIVISSAKEDIRRYLAQSPVARVRPEFAVIDHSPSIVCSLACPFPYYREFDVALLFPDIIVKPRGLLADMRNCLSRQNADIVLGLMPTARGDKMDIVACDEHGNVQSIRPKPGPGISGDTWIAAIWTPRFSNYLFAKSSDLRKQEYVSNEREVHIGDIVQAAIDDGFAVICCHFPDGECHDIGTLPEYRDYWQNQ